MNQLKGTLKIYRKQEIPIMIFMLIIGLGLMIFSCTRTYYDSVAHSHMNEYLNLLTYLIVFDYSFSFSARYVMYSNFNNCRKLFYKSQIIYIFLKSFLATFMISLFVISEMMVCKIKSYDNVIDVLGNTVINLKGIELIKLMVLIFVVIILFWSISFLFASIERLGIILAIILLIALSVLKDVFFGAIKVCQNYSYMQAIALCSIITCINFVVAWGVIKKKSQIGDSWFTKCSNCFYKDDSN